MKLIASADRNWGIGRDNDLLFHASPDMKFFKQTTVGNTVVMGSSTFFSFPKQQPLPERTNIVISRRDLRIDGATVVHSVEEALEAVKDLDPDTVFVIGGQSIYEQMLPYCDTAYITRFDAQKEADKFLHDFDSDTAWILTERSDPVEWNGLRFTFDTYKRITA